MRQTLPFLLLFAPLGCGSEIILGDSESALPLAGRPGSGGGGGAGGGSGATSGASTSDAPLSAGALVWSADHESGDFSDWERDGDFYGGEYEWGDVSSYVDVGVGRDDTSGVVARIDTGARGETSGGVRMYRRIEPGAAYYSAWFKLEEAHRVTDWWSIFLFHARDASLSLENDVSLWDVRLVNDDAGRLSLQFFDHDTMRGTASPADQGRLTPGTWFELKAYLDYRPPDSTRVSVWQNDTLLFDMKNLRTNAEENVYWCVGNGAAELSPADSTLYLDDAAVRAAVSP
jgi:hypothetical protein